MTPPWIRQTLAVLDMAGAVARLMSRLIGR